VKPSESESNKRGDRETAYGTGVVVLVVSAPGERRVQLETTLARRGFVLVFAESAEEGARKLAANRSTRLVVIGLPLAGVTARELVKALRGIDTHVPMIFIGRDVDVSKAEDAIALGAADYLEDALTKPHEFLSRVGFVVGARREDRHLQYLHTKALPSAGWDSIIGHSPALQHVVSVLQQVVARAQRGATPTIYLGGETGTGKGFIAKCVHSNGVRKNRPFVEVNCAALPAALIEAELFGHERGSFTDARSARSGLFETADGGTLFLDEIGAVPLDLQAKLLTAIEEKRVRRIGARSSSVVDIQIIAATHEDLRRKVKAGTFREDLFHRLNVVSVVIPPLRERGDDAIVLGDWFLQMFCREYGMPRRTFGEDAKRWMRGYSWPGNVRELRNQVERLVLLRDDEIVSAEQFHPSSDGPRSARTVHIEQLNGEVRVSLPAKGVPLEELEREILRQALKQCEGNVSRAARFLSISRQTFIYRMKKHNLLGVAQDAR
jgi:two-component system, NtrC family, response regulator AtoC